MKNIYRKLRIFFPGRKFYILILNILGLFVVSLFEMLGVAAILPIVNLAMGAPITGYLRTVAELFGNSDRTQLIVIFGVALVLAFVIKGVLSLVIKRWSLGFIATQQSITSVNLLNCYMREPYLVHRKRGAAAVLNSVNDIVGQAYSAFVNGVMSLCRFPRFSLLPTSAWLPLRCNTFCEGKIRSRARLSWKLRAVR